jgi:hypothetical protein
MQQFASCAVKTQICFICCDLLSISLPALLLSSNQPTSPTLFARIVFWISNPHFYERFFPNFPVANG